MSASSDAKKNPPIKSLAQIMEMTGVARSTLDDWEINRPKLWKIIVFGCQKKLEAQNK